jgi:excisionase family DNA binding protein
VARTLQKIEEHLAALRDGYAKASRDWLTVQEAADELRVSRDTIERLIGSGKLRAAEVATRMGTGLRHRYRIRREWLDEYLLASTGPAEPLTNHSRLKRQGSQGVDFIGD